MTEGAGREGPGKRAASRRVALISRSGHRQTLLLVLCSAHKQSDSNDTLQVPGEQHVRRREYTAGSTARRYEGTKVRGNGAVTARAVYSCVYPSMAPCLPSSVPAATLCVWCEREKNSKQ